MSPLRNQQIGAEQALIQPPKRSNKPKKRFKNPQSRSHFDSSFSWQSHS